MKGKRLGPYEISEQLGAGGMGEVWLAEDTRLGRRVAVKVLPGEFASDPERLARFEQEARAAAALNHPHIAAVHDVGVDDGVHYMVQEYLQGQPLRDALEKGALPLKKALALGTEIAEALRAAHKAGIVHRDLKPENIFVTLDGHAKVLDFGLAKLTEVTSGPLSSQSMSPTVLGTQVGSVMGTAGYMAPEQVQGEDVDHRADLFAFGCVLWEMVTGRRAFAGKSVPHTLHRILDEEPEGSESESATMPLRLRWLLQKALAKDPESRTQSAGDVIVELRQVMAEVESGVAVLDPTASPVQIDGPAVAASGIRPAIAVPAAILLLLAGAAAAWLLLGSASSGNNPVSRFEIKVSESGLDADYGSSVVLSPDGQTLAYATRDGLWVRRLDGLEPKRVVEAALDNPVFSPDGQWIAYEQNQTLWRVPVTGGSPLRVVEAPGDRGTDWAEADAILLSPTRRSPIVRVRVDGTGDPEPVTELQGDEITHRWPQLLPGGRAVLFTAHVDVNGFDNANLVVRDLTTGEQRVVFRGGSYGRYVPTGHLVYANGTALFAVPFDFEKLTVTGTSVPVLEGVTTNSGNGAAQYHFSDNGTVVYVPAAGDGSDSSGSWSFLDRDGNLEQSWAMSTFSYDPALSPDGTRLVATVLGDEGEQDLWSWDRGRAVATRITFEEGNDNNAVWLPGGRELIFSANRDGIVRLYRTRADGSGGGEPLPDPEERDEYPQSISADGRWLLTRIENSEGRLTFQARDLSGAEVPRVVVTGEDALSHADLSPDAGWVTYGSNESGDWEVYAVPFLAEDGNKVSVSVGGGGMPYWSEDGRSIYYRSAEGVMVADVSIVDGRLEPGVPRTLFTGDFGGGVNGLPYGTSGLKWFDISADGETVVLRQVNGAAAQTNAIIVFNWFEELERLVPTGR